MTALAETRESSGSIILYLSLIQDSGKSSRKSSLSSTPKRRSDAAFIPRRSFQGPAQHQLDSGSAKKRVKKFAKPAPPPSPPLVDADQGEEHVGGAGGDIESFEWEGAGDWDGSVCEDVQMDKMDSQMSEIAETQEEKMEEPAKEQPQITVWVGGELCHMWVDGEL